MILSLTLFGLVLNAIGLGQAVLEVSPRTYLNAKEATIQAQAALEAETPDIPAEVLLGIAWVESRYYPTAVSRIEKDSRVTGIPNWKSPPKGTRSFFCGVTQINAGNSWKKCREARDVFLAYRTTVKELTAWMSPRICGKDLRCALTGYSGGFRALKSKTRLYANYVLRRADLIKKAIRKEGQDNEKRQRTSSHGGVG